MYRKIALAWAFVVVCVFVLTASNSKAASAQRTLKVKVNYTGTEKVDQQHKIYVLVFDANPFTSKSLIDVTGIAARPAPEKGVCHILRRETASGKKQTLTFNGLAGPSVAGPSSLPCRRGDGGEDGAAPDGPRLSLAPPPRHFDDHEAAARALADEDTDESPKGSQG